MKNKIFKTSLILFTIIFSNSCTINKLEFEVKANFDVDVNVGTNYDGGNALLNPPVSSFIGNAEIDLEDKIDDINSINTLEVTSVILNLVNYNAFSMNGCCRDYSDTPLTGKLKVELLSNSSNKVLFDDDIDLGSNQSSVGPSPNIEFAAAPFVTLPISTTSALELIENKKVKLKLTMTNGNIRDDAFTINMIVNTRAITEQ